MNFEDWMIHRGLSSSSVKKYVGAVQGVLSQWSIDHELMAGPLTSIISQSTFNLLVPKIHALSIFKERNERGHNMYSSALQKFSEYLAEGYESDVETDIDEILENDELTRTEQSNLVKSRIGQGVFRQKLLTYWAACSVTGFKDTRLLVASHIKPWCESNNSERLNPFNGLLLTPNLDKAFDAGFITFSSSGVIEMSPLLTEPEKLGITSSMRVLLDGRHESFMSFHRREVYRAT